MADGSIRAPRQFQNVSDIHAVIVDFRPASAQVSRRSEHFKLI
jgi:hypothetical protein